MNCRGRIAAGAISLLIYLIIFLLSSLPAGSLPSSLPDFIPHALEYFALAFFVIQMFRRHARRPAVVFIMIAILAILDEWHQLSVPGRVFSWLDWIYDLTGGAVGMACFRFLEKAQVQNNGLARRLNFLLLNR